MKLSCFVYKVRVTMKFCLGGVVDLVIPFWSAVSDPVRVPHRLLKQLRA